MQHSKLIIACSRPPQPRKSSINKGKFARNTTNSELSLRTLYCLPSSMTLFIRYVSLPQTVEATSVHIKCLQWYSHGQFCFLRVYFTQLISPKMINSPSSSLPMTWHGRQRLEHQNFSLLSHDSNTCHSSSQTPGIRYSHWKHRGLHHNLHAEEY